MATHYEAPNHVTESLPSADYFRQIVPLFRPRSGQPTTQPGPSKWPKIFVSMTFSFRSTLATLTQIMLFVEIFLKFSKKCIFFKEQFFVKENEFWNIQLFQHGTLKNN
jgi:hypothetical protein